MAMSERSGRIRNENNRWINEADWLEATTTTFNQNITVEPTQQFVYKSVFPLSGQRDVQTTTGDGAISQQNGSEYRLRVTSGTAMLSSKQTGDYIPYYEMVPGLAVRTVGTLSGAAKIQWGYFNYDSGIQDGTFAEYNANGFFHKVYKNGSEVYSKSISHDPADGFVYHFPFVYYAYGFAGFDLVDRDSQGILRAQRKSTYYPEAQTMMNQSNLPLNVRIEGDGSQIDAFVGGRHITVLGKSDRLFRTVSEIRKEQGSIGSSNYVPMLSVRTKSAFDMIFVELGKLSIIADANMEFAIFRNTTVTSASFGTPADYTASECATEWDNSGTGISGGEQIYGDLAQGGTGVKATFTPIELPDKPIVDGDTWTFCLRLLSGSGGTASMSATVRENW